MALVSVLWLASLGCARAQVGLANAPALGGTPIADTRVHDVVADGCDACGPDPRHRTMACQATEPPSGPALAVSRSLRSPPHRGTTAALRWVEHYYARWPCNLQDENEEAPLVATRLSPYTVLACPEDAP
jgi:hypothetical protein